MLNLIDKDFKTTIPHIFKELKETTFKEEKEDTMTMSHQIQNINKETEFIQEELSDICRVKICSDWKEKFTRGTQQ